MAEADIARECAHCAAPFEPGYAWSIYCSAECGLKAKRAKARQSRVDDPTHRERWLQRKREYNARKCAREGRPYYPGKGRPNRPRIVRPGPTPEQQARKAWRDWVQRAPAWWKEAAKRARDALKTIKGGGDADELRARWRHARHLRRARKRSQSDGTMTSRWLEALYDDATNCLYCDIPLTRTDPEIGYRPTDATLDHLNPINRGGVHGKVNAVIACARCNYTKHDTPLVEWLGRIAPDRAAAVRRLYLKRFGARPEQGLML